MNKKYLISIKDLVYLIVILIGVIITLLTIRLGDNGSVVDYFGFAGTLISIVLAVVALIYAFFQSITYGNANSKLEESAKKIEEVTDDLKKVSNIENLTKDLTSSVEEVKSNIHQAIAGINEMSATFQNNIIEFQSLVSNLDIIHTSVVETRQDILTKLNVVGSENTNKETPIVAVREEWIGIIVSAMHRFHILYLFYLSLVHDSGVRTNWQQYVEWALNNDLAFWNELWKNEHEKADEERDTNNIQVVLQRNIGVLMSIHPSLVNNGWIKVSGKIYDVEVNEYNDILKESVRKRIEELDLDKSSEIIELINNNKIVKE
ncbi:hypothetical protein [Paenibacillus sp. EZ-K15]|uniref:hypothetical protein n=1 Tax=Paenibacillus sp. EZ-K15 TaxID=2044275 RepID=UPI000BF7AEDC|nr:hypothetical protein [Paenibacillus sp. EZ-K15]